MAVQHLPRDIARTSLKELLKRLKNRDINGIFDQIFSYFSQNGDKRFYFVRTWL